MKVSDIKCRKCKKDAMEAEKGAYLERVSPKGQKPIIMECSPNCAYIYGKTGNQDDALINAIKGV